MHDTMIASYQKCSRLTLNTFGIEHPERVTSPFSLMMSHQPACLAAEGRNMHNRLNHFSSILRSQLAEMQSFSGRRPQYTERSELRPQVAHKNTNESSDRIIRGRRPQSSNHGLKNSESEKTHSRPWVAKHTHRSSIRGRRPQSSTHSRPQVANHT